MTGASELNSTCTSKNYCTRIYYYTNSMKFCFLVRYSPNACADIGRCAWGVTAAACAVSRKLDHNINTSTVKKAYLEEIKENRIVEGSGNLSELPTKKREDEFCWMMIWIGRYSCI